MKDIEWLTGLIEGEGCLGYRPVGTRRKDGGRYCTPHIQVAMTDKDVVEDVAKFFGTKVMSRGATVKEKPIWIARSIGIKALDLMLKMYPLFGSRRQSKVREVLSRFEHSEGLHVY